jgi:hypothetical protein
MPNPTPRLPSTPLAIERVILYGDVRVVVARSPEAETLMGVKSAPGPQGRYVFLPVDADEVDDFEDGEVSLYHVIARTAADADALHLPAYEVDALVRLQRVPTAVAGSPSPRRCP